MVAAAMTVAGRHEVEEVDGVVKEEEAEGVGVGVEMEIMEVEAALAVVVVAAEVVKKAKAVLEGENREAMGENPHREGTTR